MKKPSLFSPQVRTTAEPGRQARALDLPATGSLEAIAQLSVNHQVSTQALGEEAINLLFEKHRLNRIA